MFIRSRCTGHYDSLSIPLAVGVFRQRELICKQLFSLHRRCIATLKSRSGSFFCAKESYVGFIAEDVPELVATGDRQGLSAMDIVAVLTKVVQAQQQRIDELKSPLTSGEQNAQ